MIMAHALILAMRKLQKGKGGEVCVQYKHFTVMTTVIKTCCLDTCLSSGNMKKMKKNFQNIKEHPVSKWNFFFFKFFFIMVGLCYWFCLNRKYGFLFGGFVPEKKEETQNKKQKKNSGTFKQFQHCHFLHFNKEGGSSVYKRKEKKGGVLRTSIWQKQQLRQMVLQFHSIPFWLQPGRWFRIGVSQEETQMSVLGGKKKVGENDVSIT